MASCEQRLLIGDARRIDEVPSDSVALVVTSPPYPMIEMWDPLFRAADPAIADALDQPDAGTAFDLMHAWLQPVWEECFRVLIPGGFLCLNIGDATRKLGDHFRLHSNHARLLERCTALGFSALPDILWRKPTNAPNKFLGSGMLPAGAYVTYEHEYILILRKGGGRRFTKAAEKEARRRSAYFWEERNLWFSDLWSSISGTSQKLGAPDARARSAAFPFEIPYRLIQMFSLQGETVLDPFLGTGTTLAAAAASGRCGLGIEKDPELRCAIAESLEASVEIGAERARQRLDDHRRFVSEREAKGKGFKHFNEAHQIPVITAQETKLRLLSPSGLEAHEDGWRLRYETARASS